MSKTKSITPFDRSMKRVRAKLNRERKEMVWQINDSLPYLSLEGMRAILHLAWVDASHTRHMASKVNAMFAKRRKSR